MSTISFFIALMTAIYVFQNRTGSQHEFDRYRVRANERLARLEGIAQSHGWKLPRCSFGFFEDIDVYPDSDLDDENGKWKTE